MASASSIRIAHAGDLSTAAATNLRWIVGEVGDRFQEIAIADGERVVGAWIYDHPERHGRGTWVRSIRTDVAKGFQGRGLATRLWFHGIERWKPSRIIASWVSDQGRGFLARMFAELALRAPAIYLDVVHGDKDLDLWNYERAQSAERLLRAIGEGKRAERATPQLTAIAGGKS